jgi:tRNA(fMet)-specific endonuclease VapC
VGLIVDTNVFIAYEKSGAAIDLDARHPNEEVCISAIIVSELLVGVHRANTEERRTQRAKFVEGILMHVRVLDFTTDVAKIHAAVQADLSNRGVPIGAHDLIIAATAKRYDFSVLTDNVDEFRRVPGLNVIPFALKP